jgi:histidinol phosphatase-like PHP family hydrolase
VLSNADLAEALFQLAESHPPGDERWTLMRAGYALFDHARELAGSRRWPDAVPLDALPTLAMLRSCQGSDALAAAVQRLAGPHRPRRAATRDGYLSAADVAHVLTDPGELDPRQLRGAAHWHTRASDGAATLEVMARACVRRGASWAVVSDHTRGLSCVNGLDGEGIAMQRRAVAAWNRRHSDELTLLQGLEVEVLEDGRLDLPRPARGGLLLIAAIHSDLDEQKDSTGRLLRALDEPGVWALAHPRCRLFARRRGLRASWEAVFEAAAARGVLLEVNGFPRRQDLDVSLLSLALAAGCRFVLASDAHHPRHLAFDSLAVALARLAGVPRTRIVTFSPVHDVADEATGSWD